MSPDTHARLARRHLHQARAHLQEARMNPNDFRADLAARTHARDALRHATLSERPHPEWGGVIIRTR